MVIFGVLKSVRLYQSVSTPGHPLINFHFLYLNLLKIRPISFIKKENKKTSIPNGFCRTIAQIREMLIAKRVDVVNKRFSFAFEIIYNIMPLADSVNAF